MFYNNVLYSACSVELLWYRDNVSSQSAQLVDGVGFWSFKSCTWKEITAEMVGVLVGVIVIG